MNFLFVTTTGSIYDIVFALQHMGHSVTVLEHHPFDPLDLITKAPLAAVEKHLKEESFDYAITYLYLPLLSDLCQTYKVPYISWIYDSPLLSLFHRSVWNSVNRIFIFDSAFYRRLVQIGIPHVYYMPFASNTTRLNRMNYTDDDCEKYSSQISFVGKLYEKNAYNSSLGTLPPDIVTQMNYYLLHHLCDWHTTRSWPLTSDETTSYLLAHTDHSSTLSTFEIPANIYYGILYLTRKLGEMERITALNTLAEQYPVDLYSTSSSDQIGILRTHEPVNYYTEIAKVYRFSKISLNLTLPSIETGAPQRIFDILACRGFCLTNYQADLNELFEIGKDLVVFHDLDELKELTHYYLTHEEERLAIALHGCETVNRLYTYEHQLTHILQICASTPVELS